MRLKVAVCVFALVAVAGLGASSPSRQAIASDNATANYYPMKEGNKWEYRTTVEGQTMFCTMQISKVEKVDGVDRFQVDVLIDGNVVSFENVFSTSKGIFRSGVNGQMLAKPICLLKLPVKTGETWLDTVDSDGEQGVIKGKIGAEVEIEVPAGKFKAVPAILEIEEGGELVTITHYFVANIGIVRQTVEVGDEMIVMELEKMPVIR